MGGRDVDSKTNAGYILLSFAFLEQPQNGDFKQKVDWQTDKSSSTCAVCSEKFFVFKRRHHCRKCGMIVCENCSKGRMILNAEEKIPVRVCDACNPNKKAVSHRNPHNLSLTASYDREGKGERGEGEGE